MLSAPSTGAEVETERPVQDEAEARAEQAASDDQHLGWHHARTRLVIIGKLLRGGRTSIMFEERCAAVARTFHFLYDACAAPAVGARASLPAAGAS